MLTRVRATLANQLPAFLVDELIDAYVDAKRSYFLGGLRLSGVEGGRFSEAAFRLLEHIATGASTPIGQTLATDAVIQRLASVPRGSLPESIRLHIPRSLRVVYDIRNRRDVAHLADGIDPNLQDGTLVVGVLDWIVAELLRLYHSGLEPNEAARMVDSLVTRRAPVVQDFSGFPKVLKTGLASGDHVLVLLYDRGGAGATFDELRQWVVPAMRANLRRTLERLVHKTATVHYDGDRYIITRSGELDVEARRLVEP